MKASSRGFNPSYQEDSPTHDEIKNSDGYIFLEFGAPWCGHCQAAAPAIKSALSPLEQLHVKVFDGKGKALGRSFNVTLWPTLILLASGVEVARIVRPTDLDDVKKLTQKMAG